MTAFQCIFINFACNTCNEIVQKSNNLLGLFEATLRHGVRARFLQMIRAAGGTQLATVDSNAIKSRQPLIHFRISCRVLVRNCA